VVPGELVGVVEEFFPGIGTYNLDGGIRSEVVGILVIDRVTRVGSVLRRTRRPVFPRRGSTVVGQVVTVQPKVANVNLFRIGDEFILNPFAGMLYISRVGNAYLKKLQDAVKAGDVVRAKVAATSNAGCLLTTVGSRLGVIQAFCSSCGQRLLPKEGPRLVCRNCGAVETRKVAEDYGLPLEGS